MNKESNFYKTLMPTAILTFVILLVPFILMQFSNEVSWSFSDFIFAGLIIFGFSSIYKVITIKKGNKHYRLATGLFIISIVMLIWVNGAVGILGSEKNPENILYGTVILIGIFGSMLSKLKSEGMKVTLWAMALMQVLVPLVAWFIFKPASMNAKEFLLTWHDHGIWGVIGVSTFFAIMFLISGLLYNYDTLKQ